MTLLSNFSCKSGRSLYYLFQESYVYFMTTACGRPQRDRGLSSSCGQGRGRKSRFSCGRPKWMTPYAFLLSC